MHIPDDPLYYEKFYFTPGDTGFRAWDTKYGKIGVLICWDQWFPEGARLTALQGAEILFYPTAIGWHPSEKAEYGEAQHESWELIQRSHAVANGCYVCAPNRIGLEKILGARRQAGERRRHRVLGPIVRRRSKWADRQEGSSEQGRNSGRADCDLEKVEFSRTHWPFLRDRRIDAYGDLTKRFVDIDSPMKRIEIVTSEDVRSELEKSPFIPFRMHLVSGKTIDIGEPGVAWLLKNCDADLSDSATARRADYDMVALRNIERLEQLAFVARLEANMLMLRRSESQELTREPFVPLRLHFRNGKKFGCSISRGRAFTRLWRAGLHRTETGNSSSQKLRQVWL